MSAFKIRIIQPTILEYRVGLYAGLAKRYGNRMEIWAAEKDGVDVSVPLNGINTDYTHSFIHIGPLLWQKRLSLKGLSKGDVLVICSDIHNLSVMLLALRAKTKGVRVVCWGHHWTAGGRMWRVKIRLMIAKAISDVYLCYTKTGIDFLCRLGFDGTRVFATGNTIDQIPIGKATGHWNDENLRLFKEECGISGKVLLLVCGVLRPKMRLHQLIEAIADKRLMDRDIMVAIIGDGVEKERNVALARQLKVEDKVIWVGATRDQEVMAPWFLSATAFVYPGAIGLTILHSMSYGLPVVVHGNKEHQMPEFEVMEDGLTGILFEENSVDDLARKILWICENVESIKKMKDYCRNKAWNEYTMDQMVANYAGAIECAAKCE